MYCSYYDSISILKFIERSNRLLFEPLTAPSRDNRPNTVAEDDNPYVPRNSPQPSETWSKCLISAMTPIMWKTTANRKLRVSSAYTMKPSRDILRAQVARTSQSLTTPLVYTAAQGPPERRIRKEKTMKPQFSRQTAIAVVLAAFLVLLWPPAQAQRFSDWGPPVNVGMPDRAQSVVSASTTEDLYAAVNNPANEGVRDSGAPV